MFVKQQASQLFDLFKRKAGRLEDPSEPIGHGVLVLFAGALLLTQAFSQILLVSFYLSQIFDIGCLENLKKNLFTWVVLMRVLHIKTKQFMMQNIKISHLTMDHLGKKTQTLKTETL